MPERGGFELRLDLGIPILQLTLLALFAWVFLIGGTVTFGTWGDVDVRLMASYLMPALALHAWSALPRSPRLWPRVLAWLLVFAMLAHTQVLLQPVLLATLGLMAVLDCGLHSTRVPKREKAPLGARIAAGVAALAGVAVLVFLFQFATFDALVRLGAAAMLASALAVAAALYPSMREPLRLLPSLGVYYLFFVLVAAPILPFGPALAWWLLCGAVFLGAVVSARHVSGPELPAGQTRHEHVVSTLPDPFVAADAEAVERFLATGQGARELSQRIERARGLDGAGKALAKAVKELAGSRATRAHREYALRRMLELNE